MNQAYVAATQRLEEMSRLAIEITASVLERYWKALVSYPEMD